MNRKKPLKISFCFISDEPRKTHSKEKIWASIWLCHLFLIIFVTYKLGLEMNIINRDSSTAEVAAFYIRKSMYFSIRRPRFSHGSFDNSWYKNGHYFISLDLSF